MPPKTLAPTNRRAQFDHKAAEAQGEGYFQTPGMARQANGPLPLSHMTLKIYLEKARNQLYVDMALMYDRMVADLMNAWWDELQAKLVNSAAPETHAQAQARKVDIAAQLNPSGEAQPL
jgi:hypothetical protein